MNYMYPTSYRPVEWLGGPLDGEVVLVLNTLNQIQYPSGISVFNPYRSTITETVSVPIKVINDKEYLVWDERN